jgi:hypothetical protein
MMGDDPRIIMVDRAVDRIERVIGERLDYAERYEVTRVLDELLSDAMRLAGEIDGRFW